MSGLIAPYPELNSCAAAVWPLRKDFPKRSARSRIFSSGPMKLPNRVFSLRLMNLTYDAGSIFIRSRIGGRFLGMLPRLPSITARPDQSTSSRVVPDFIGNRPLGVLRRLVGEWQEFANGGQQVFR